MRLRLQAVGLLLPILISPLVRPGLSRAQSNNGFRGFGDPPSADAPLDTQPFSDVDQDLFLVHGLRLIYTNWPNADDQKKLAKQIADTRAMATMLRRAGNAGNADRGLLASYDNCLALLDAYQTYLTNVGAINRQTMDSVTKGALGALGQAGVDWLRGRVVDNKSAQDASNGAAFTFFWQALKSGYAISRERSAAMEAEKQKFAAQSRTVYASANAVVQRLANEHRWQPGEAGLENSRESLRDQANRRLRDPFALYALATVEDRNETTAGAMSKANWCVRAAQLVPAGVAYNPFRTGFIQQAVSSGLLAAFLERPYYAGPPSHSAPQALRLARTYLALDPADATGFGHTQLVRALAFNGRYYDALEAANMASKYSSGDPALAYRYALLMSLTNSPDKSAEYLFSAYRLGFNDVHDVRVTPDLQNLRRVRPRLYEQLTTVKLSPSIQFNPGLPDNILIRNDSLFELTNVHFKALITNQGQRYTPDVTVQSIKAGDTYKANGATYIVGNRYDSFTYSLSCDQCN